MPRIIKEEPNAASATSPMQLDNPIPLAPVVALTKPQRPKSKSLQPCRCPKEGCGKMFSKRSNLKAHMRVHSGVLPYPCEFPGCTKRFRWKSSLKPHVKVHIASGHTLNQSLCSSSPSRTPETSDPRAVSQIAETSATGSPHGATEPATPATKTAFHGSFLNLPAQDIFTGMPDIAGSSPTTVMECSLFGSPITPENIPGQANSRQHSCCFPGCGKSFSRMSHLLEHEVLACHHGNRPQVASALFQDTQHQNESAEQGEIDLSCDSVLSDSQASYQTDVLSFTLDSPAEEGSTSLNDVHITDITEDLWKHDINVMDPFMDFSVNFGNGGKVMDMLSTGDCSSGISASNDETVSLPESQWIMQPNGSTASSADFTSSLYIQ